METDFPSVASGLEGGAAALRAHNGPVGQMGTVGHGGGAVSHAAAAAAPMEWMERQGNDAGMMDVQVGSCFGGLLLKQRFFGASGGWQVCDVYECCGCSWSVGTVRNVSYDGDVDRSKDTSVCVVVRQR